MLVRLEAQFCQYRVAGVELAQGSVAKQGYRQAILVLAPKCLKHDGTLCRLSPCPPCWAPEHMEFALLSNIQIYFETLLPIVHLSRQKSTKPGQEVNPFSMD